MACCYELWSWLCIDFQREGMSNKRKYRYRKCSEVYKQSWRTIEQWPRKFSFVFKHCWILLSFVSIFQFLLFLRVWIYGSWYIFIHNITSANFIHYYGMTRGLGLLRYFLKSIPLLLCQLFLPSNCRSFCPQPHDFISHIPVFLIFSVIIL